MTIREAIKFYTDRKATVLKKSYLEVVRSTSLCIIIPLKNGSKVFLDTHPEIPSFWEDYALDMPNKNGVFKRLSFEILDTGVEVVIPRSISNKVSDSSANGILYFVDTATERAVNEFISCNGGIDVDNFVKDVEFLW